MYSDLSKMVLEVNSIKPESEKEFIKELRLTLRLDYGMNSKEVSRLNDNKVIETWYEISSKNIISGQ